MRTREVGRTVPEAAVLLLVGGEVRIAADRKRRRGYYMSTEENREDKIFTACREEGRRQSGQELVLHQS